MSSDNQRVVFDHRFERRTEVTGNSKLRLWVATDVTNDADLFVGIEKLDRNGNVVPFTFSMMFNDGPAAFGWLRASYRELVEDRQTWNRGNPRRFGAEPSDRVDPSPDTNFHWYCRNIVNRFFASFQRQPLKAW